MIDIKTFQCNMLQENTYIVSDDSQECVIIDCGAYFDPERTAIVDYIRQKQLTPVHLLCTHGHLDHCFGNDTIYEAFGLKPEIHSEDNFLVYDLAKQAKDFFGMDYTHPTPPVGRFLSHGDCISFGTHQFTVLHTPGHTPGGVLFYCQKENIVFSGDTLFNMSIGRTDFERSSWSDMIQSLRTVVSKLPDETTVYCGHGPKTRIGSEKTMNPYLR
jgi:glyoxylase-like metal-dependent hydrolase (beta-lactamase superfamily II)